MIQVSMTPEVFTAKAAQLKAEQGIELTGTDGWIHHDGVIAGWFYRDGQVSVTITKKPFFISLAQCESKLRDWLTGP